MKTLEGYRERGELRADTDVATAARAIFSLNIGYFLARHVFAPDEPWDDAAEARRMADLIWSGLAAKGRR